MKRWQSHYDAIHNNYTDIEVLADFSNAIEAIKYLNQRAVDLFF
jgi:hypothetical protein